MAGCISAPYWRGGGVKRARGSALAVEEIARLNQIEGWPAPEESAKWLGDPTVERTLLDAYRSGRMHHAWLICGPKGIGKATLAYRFARFVLAHPDPGSAAVAAAVNLDISADHPAFRKVAARSHPNLLPLQRGYNDERKRYFTELSVGEIRRTVSFFGSTSAEPGWRIAIVDPADDMNANAANALLKILEEPPNRSLFLIVSNAPGQLVPTIRSRCRRLDVPPLTQDAIETAIRNGAADISDIDESELRVASALADGSLRRAIHLLKEGGLKVYRDLGRLLGGAPELDIRQMHAFADSITGKGADDAFDGFLDALRAWLDRRVRGEIEPDKSLTLSPAVEAAPLETWAEVWENVRHSSTLAEALNLDRKQAVLSILMNLARATRM
jgi:DNA polymerase-3 subunit delta'